MSDPKLVAAMAEIRALLTRLDIAGFVILHNAPGDLESALHLSPSYSVAHLETDRDGNAAMRIRSQAGAYSGDTEKQKRDLEATMNMLSGFGEIAGRNALLLLEATEAVKSAMPGMIQQEPLHRTDGKR